jgi:hypothetical protein
VPRARRSAAAAVPDPLRACGVTRREADILALLAAGLTNADIAARLYLSVRTVESHVSSLLAKLGARIEPTSPLATWNSSDARDGDAEIACPPAEAERLGSVPRLGRGRSAPTVIPPKSAVYLLEETWTRRTRRYTPSHGRLLSLP